MKQRSELSPPAGRVEHAAATGSRGTPRCKGLNFISSFPMAVYTYVCAKIVQTSGNFHLNLNWKPYKKNNGGQRNKMTWKASFCKDRSKSPPSTQFLSCAPHTWEPPKHRMPWCLCLQASASSKHLFYFHINLSHSYTWTPHSLQTQPLAQVLVAHFAGGWGDGWGGKLKGGDGRGIFTLTCLW